MVIGSGGVLNSTELLGIGYLCPQMEFLIAKGRLLLIVQLD